MSLRAAARFAALSPRRQTLVVASAVLALALLSVGGARTWQLMNRSIAAARPAPLRPGAVLLVPGNGDNPGSLSPLAARIREAGRDAVIVRLLGNGAGGLQAQARALNAYVVGALRGGAPSVDVVGYSAGGVVARLWDAAYGGASTARRIITLGSPLHGTAPVGARPAWLSLWTDDDRVVRPPDSARLAGAVNVALQSVCPGAVIEHDQLPTDPLVVGIVLQAIGTAPLTAPQAADCGSLRALGRAPASLSAAGGSRRALARTTG